MGGSGLDRINFCGLGLDSDWKISQSAHLDDFFYCKSTNTQARNQGCEAPLENFSLPLEKYVVHCLKGLHIV